MRIAIFSHEVYMCTIPQTMDNKYSNQIKSIIIIYTTQLQLRTIYDFMSPEIIIIHKIVSIFKFHNLRKSYSIIIKLW